MGLNIDVSSSGVKVTYTSSTLSKIDSWTKKISDFASKTPSQHIADKINSELRKYQKWLTPPKPKLIKNYDKFMKKVKQLNKDAEKAEKALAMFEKIAKKYPYPADLESERELIDIARQRANADNGAV